MPTCARTGPFWPVSCPQPPAAAQPRPFPNIERWFKAIDARPAAARARAVGTDHDFKKTQDEDAKRHLYPSNYPPAAA